MGKTTWEEIEMIRESAKAKTKTLNAKVASVALAFSALLTLLLTHTSVPLAPLRIITIAIATIAVWAFVDEMGVRKPLNRAGLVCFAIAVLCKIQISLGIDQSILGKYLLSYSAFLLLAVLLWSVAFLHRKKALKYVGAIGLAATIAPLLAILLGHIAVGYGAFLGVGAILAASNGSIVQDAGFVVVVERIFGLWAYVAAFMLWRGHIVSTQEPKIA